MPTASRTFRIFVSSTFSDLKAERDALQKYVFPRLRELAEAHGCRFQAIDLRWGVSEEAALDQQTMKICLAEIERCQKVTPRPNFVILLGDRYGWRPLPYAIPATEFETMLPLTAPEVRDRLEWREEQPDGEKGWYRGDDNAVPAEYVLQPRQRGSRFEAYDAWASEVERPLAAALEGAALAAGIQGEALVKYTCSATEQEIGQGALQVADAEEHVFAFLRAIENPEVLSESLEARKYLESDPDNARRQVKLKGKLRSQLPNNIHEYTTRWQGDRLATDYIGSLPETLEACLRLDDSSQYSQTLCYGVWKTLSQVILAEAGKLEMVDALDKEQQAHVEFAGQRARLFVGRENCLEQIAAYLASDEQRPLAIWGESGTGKSALLAHAMQQAQERLGDRAVIVSRFIGATPDSTVIRALLLSLCRQVTRAYQGDESTLPLEYPDLVRELPVRLALATAERPLVIFLDALDQLSAADNAHSLVWLPGQLPSNVKCVVSTLPGECLSSLSRLEAPQLQLHGLQPGDGMDLLAEWLGIALRRLTSEQQADLLGKFNAAGGLPLYLKLAFEEARRWHSYDGLPGMSDAAPGLCADVPGVINDLFSRLEQPAQHGNVLVGRALGYLAAGKNGLTESELLEVLWLDEEILRDFIEHSPDSPWPIDALPVAVWSRLFMDLEPYLAERSADGTRTLGFYHRQLREQVEARYLTGEDRLARHRKLAGLFAGKPLQQEERANLRKLSELPYQQAGGGLWDALQATLLNYSFLYSKTKAIGVLDLVEDYDLLLSPVSPLTAEKGAGMRSIQRALRQASHVLAQDPDLLPSQLWGRLCDREQGEIQALLKGAMWEHPKPWLRPTTPSLVEDEALVRTFAGHSDYVTACAVTPDGRQVVSASYDRSLKLWDIQTGACQRTFEGHTDGVTACAVTPDGRQVISASHDKTLKLWDLSSGECLLTFKKHTSDVRACAVTPDGRQVVSASGDHTLKLWDLASGACLRTFKGHTVRVTACAVTADGRQVVSASQDKTLKLWALASGKCLRTFKGHTEAVWGCVVTPDGHQVVSASQDKTLKLWDLASGECLRTFKEHSNCVWACAVTSDGRQVVSASADKTFKLWDIQSGACLRTFAGHSGIVLFACAVTPNGRQVVSDSGDHTFKLWELSPALNTGLDSGAYLRTFEGHTWDVRACAVVPDRRQVVSASEDNTLKLWDLSRGECLRTFAGHSHWVTACAVTPDGRQVVSASYDRSLKLWDIQTGACLRTFAGHTSPVLACAVTPDGQQVVSASDDTSLKLWDLASGACLRTFKGHTGVVKGCAVTPDGQQVVSASEDNTLKLWDLSRGECLRTFAGHSHWVTACAVTLDGQQVVSASRDKTLKLWNIATGACRRTFEGHTGDVRACAVTSDGRQVVSASEDNTLKLWELKTGAQRITFVSDGIIRACAAVRDGRTIVCGGGSGRLHILRLEGMPATNGA